MKNILSILLSLIFISVYAELKPFDLQGSIRGFKTFKYAYLFDADNKIIKRVDIKSNNFEIQGKYSSALRFGQLPFIKVLLNTIT